MIGHLMKLSSAHVWLLSIAVSIAIMGLIAGATGIKLQGEAARDSLLIGIPAVLMIAFFVRNLLNYFIAQQKKSAADLHFSTPAPDETQERFVAADAVLGEEAAEVTPQPAAPYGIVNGKAAEKQIRNAGRNAELRRAIRNLDVLPAMPAIAQKLLALNLNTEEGERMLMVLIGQDPQISAKIIGLANSAVIGASRRISSVKDAALLLGAKRVQSVATGIAIISMMAKAPPCEFSIRDLWLHGFRIAAAAQGIAHFMPANMRPTDEQVFLAGMLHDIGYLVLAYLDPKLSDKLHSHLAAESMRPKMEVEREILDICHDELGAELARHWNLPEEIITALRYHHSPDEAGEAPGQILARLADIAQKLLPTNGNNESPVSEISAREWELLGINPVTTEEVREQANKRAEQASQFASAFI